MIPILDLKPQYTALQAEMDAAILAAVRSGQYINGPNVKAFEQEFARYMGVNHAVGMNSGTDALHLALRALGVGPGDEVVTVPFTFVATTEAIGIVGATPVFVDIDPVTYNMDVSQVEAVLTPRTKAILPVHLYGQSADMAPLRELADRHGLWLVEDCAQSVGATYRGQKTGTIGQVGCFSFFPSKNLGAYGDAGAAVTDDPELAARMVALRGHGGRVKYHHETLGVNSRLDEVQAAVLRVKLPHLESWNAARREVARRYDALIREAEIPGVVTPEVLAETVPVFHQYTIRVKDRDRVQKELAGRGIQTMIYYPVPLDQQAVHAHLGHGPLDFPVSARAAREVLSLPIFPEITPAQQREVVEGLKAALSLGV
jgi:dTDP-4-amino-4,6-dideoxygalactose transaminase